ncbi:MAG: hypothetical protein DCC71_00620 [Proteobacteria bacterium]|nr:MAG: hypothetical protein DCC71_00620 [Pseudomonadota bacterium]
MTAHDPVGHPILAYELRPRGPAPAGIPAEPLVDPHAERAAPGDYDARRAAFLDFVRRSPTPSHLAAVFHEVARVAAGGPVHAPLFEAALDYVDARLDCADFVQHGLLRLLLQLAGEPRLPRALLARAKRTTLGFKYHPSEPGADSLCTWTENHQILFAAADLVASERFPDEVFANTGERGRERRARARGRVLRWLDLRFRTGFSEWLSHVYYDEDLVALLTLVDFSLDAEIRTRAAMVADVVLLDMALHHFRGAFASTHGRSYERAKKWTREENTTDAAKLLFGAGSFARSENQCAVSLALSPRYRPPPAILAIAADGERAAVTVRQRMGIALGDLARFGLDPRRDEDAFALLAMEAYTDPRTIAAFVRLLERWRWWDNAFFAPFAASRALLRGLARVRALPLVAKAFEWDLARNARPAVDLVTHRTPDTQLSSALDWRPGFGGDQQHVWHASLGGDAVCFTTHPGPISARSPGWWTGSAVLPRVAQVENVAIALYRIHRRPALHVASRPLFTHAWLPRDRFDELREQGGWRFARRGDGYLALFASPAAHWNESPDAGEDRGRELVAHGRETVWICELGRRASDGPFDDFASRIAAAPLAVRGLAVAYESPSQGRLEFAWRGPLRQRGRAVPLRDFPRYDAPWVRADYPSERIEVRAGGHGLALDWPRGVRALHGPVTEAC